MESNEKQKEIKRQETFNWQRGKYFGVYEELLGHYIVQSVIENMRPSSLLDLACGNGLLTSMMSSYFDRVVGIDASAKHISEAKTKYPHITFIHSLAEEYKDTTGFDTISMITLLEHVQDPPKFLKACARNLSPNGILIAYVPTP